MYVPIKSIKTILFFLFVLPLVFGQSHLYFMKFIQQDLAYFFYVAGHASLIGLLLLCARSVAHRNSFFAVLGYLTLGVCYYIVINGSFNFYVFLNAIIVSLFIGQYANKNEKIVGFWLVIFTTGLLLISLNFISLSYWIYDADILFEQVERFTDFDRTDLDPFYFGLFGLTESYAINAFGINFGRLQGWSVEPQHWGYFVFLVMSALLALRGMGVLGSGSLLLSTLFIILYVPFLNSSSVYICLFMSVSTMAVLYVYKKIFGGKYSSFLVYFLLILFAGFIVPFTLSVFLDVESLYAENVLREGSNWKGKVEFISIGASLPFIFFPNSYSVEITHNFILNMYISSGWMIMIPVLIFAFKLVDALVCKDNLYLSCSAIIFLVAHLFLIPSIVFHPSFPLWGYMLFASHKYLSKRPNGIPEEAV